MALMMRWMMVCMVGDGFVLFGKFLKKQKIEPSWGVMVQKTITADGLKMVF